VRFVGYLILFVLLMSGLSGPVQVVRYWRLREPIICVCRLNKSIGPAFSEEPPGFTGGIANPVLELIAIYLFNAFYVAIARDIFHDFGFRPVYLDVSGFGAVGGVIEIGAAHVRNLQDHVRLPFSLLLAIPKADADILHTIA